MAITRFSGSNITTGNKKYASFDTGYPTIMAAPTATDGGTGTTVSVAFTAQTGATSYTAISSPGSFTGTGASSPITVSGLTAGTAYTFQIRANNAVGNGPYSAASNSVTPIDPAGWEVLATSTPSGVGNVTFSSINQTYQHLMIRYYVFTSSDTDLSIQVNGDTSSSYHTWGYRAAASSVLGSIATSTDRSVITGTYGGSGLTYPLVGTILIPDYSINGTKVKSWLAQTGSGGVSGEGQSAVAIGYLNSTANISSLTIQPGANFASNSRITLYGISG